MIAILFILLSNFDAMADTLDTETELLLKAKSRTEVNNTVLTANELLHRKTECEAQLRTSKPPTSCLSAVRIEMKLEIIDAHRGQILIDGFASTCEERAKLETSLEFLDAALKAGGTDRCSRALIKRRDELLYIMSARANRSGS